MKGIEGSLKDDRLSSGNVAGPSSLEQIRRRNRLGHSPERLASGQRQGQREIPETPEERRKETENMIWKLHKKYDAYVNEYNKYQQWLGPEKVTSLDNDSYRIEYEDMEKKRDWVNDEHKSMDWVMEMFSGDLDYLGRIYGEYRSKQGKKIDEMCKEEFLRKRDLLEKVNLRMQELID